MTTTPYATREEYRALYDSDLSDERLDALLAKASRLIAAELAAAGRSDEDVEADVLADVCVDVAHRADPGAGADAIPFGASQVTMSTSGGPYSTSDSFTLANPHGDLWLNRAQRRLLGIGARIGFAPLAGGGADA